MLLAFVILCVGFFGVGIDFVGVAGLLWLDGDGDGEGGGMWMRRWRRNGVGGLAFFLVWVEWECEGGEGNAEIGRW